MYLQAEYSVKTKNLNVEVRAIFVNVKCFFDFEFECGICSVDDFKVRGWIAILHEDDFKRCR